MNMYYATPITSLGSVDQSGPPPKPVDIPKAILDVAVPLAGVAGPIALGRWLAPDDKQWIGWVGGAAIGIPIALALNLVRAFGGPTGWDLLEHSRPVTIHRDPRW